MRICNLQKDIEKEPISGRGKSFDYCYSYFRSFYDNGNTLQLASKENIEKSCLEIGLYLASWGMYRGSSSLLKKTSVKHYEKLIKMVSSANTLYWEIDANKYTEENKTKLLECASMIRDALWINNISRPSYTLITKVMLGVFGNTPAFDTYFKKGMAAVELNVGGFNKKSLDKIGKFYVTYKDDLDNIRPKIKIISFLTGESSGVACPIVKLIDLVCWLDGNNNVS